MDTESNKGIYKPQKEKRKPDNINGLQSKKIYKSSKQIKYY